MINFSTVVSSASVFVLNEETSRGGPVFVQVVQALAITMGVNPDSLTPSQDEVFADFAKWVNHNKGASQADRKLPALLRSHTKPLVKPAFFYANLNEGHSMVVIWTNAEGKVGNVG
jgi:hypothetical protein